LGSQKDGTLGKAVVKKFAPGKRGQNVVEAQGVDDSAPEGGKKTRKIDKEGAGARGGVVEHCGN